MRTLYTDKNTVNFSRVKLTELALLGTIMLWKGGAERTLNFISLL